MTTVFTAILVYGHLFYSDSTIMGLKVAHDRKKNFKNTVIKPFFVAYLFLIRYKPRVIQLEITRILCATLDARVSSIPSIGRARTHEFRLVR